MLWIVVLEKTLKSPLNCKEIKLVNPKGNQSWIFIGRTDAKAEAPILRPPDVKNWLLRKDPDAGKDWGWEEKGVHRKWDGWMASLTQWAWVWASPGVGDGQGGLACCSPWSQRVGHDWVNWTDMYNSTFLHFPFQMRKSSKVNPNKTFYQLPFVWGSGTCSQTQMDVCLPLTVECLQFLPGGSEAQWDGGRQRRAREANIPRSQGRASRATDAQSPQSGFDLSDFLTKLSPPLQFTLISSLSFTLFLSLLFSG